MAERQKMCQSEELKSYVPPSDPNWPLQWYLVSVPLSAIAVNMLYALNNIRAMNIGSM